MEGALNIAILQSPGDLGSPANRLQWLTSQLETGIAEQTDLLVLPELFQSGYNAYDTINSVAEAVDGPFEQAIAQLSIVNELAIVYGYAEMFSGDIYNSAQSIDKLGCTIVSYYSRLGLKQHFLNKAMPAVSLG
jgi:predicted amidohydrolase